MVHLQNAPVDKKEQVDNERAILWRFSTWGSLRVADAAVVRPRRFRTDTFLADGH